ncbi:unnamed protein product [Prunus armeniaca]|uniref:Uncharacterized protein n=1 Tax=Prunus armeniaca TaxID=36596 RepID=A0A6J5VEN4_PRUAR|nr:unnamed protein product [Prunus armeniaca]
MNTPIAIFLVSFFIFLVNLIRLKTRNRNKGVSLPPGPTPWPIVGCVPEMWRNRPAYKWTHRVLKELNTDIACIKLGNVHVIPVISPEIAREFLKKNDAVFASRPVTMATDILSNGFLTTAVVPWGGQWKKMRKVLVADVFNHSRVQWLLGKRNEEADNLVKFLYNQYSSNPNGSVVNVRTAAQFYTGNVMRRMIFNTRYFGKGRKDRGPGFEEEQHVSALLTILMHMYAFCISDYLPWLRVFDISGHEKKVRGALKIIKQYQDPLIDERLKEWRDGRTKEPEDLLDVFISLKDANGQPLLSGEEIKAQITELQLATVDNPSNAAEWALTEMLNQPELLKKAEEELDRVVGKQRFVQESDVPKLPYVRACAREALRLHPITAFNVPHVSNTDAVVAGYFIPKGSSVLLSRLGLGRNPEVWENPLRFDPERHLKGDADQQVDLQEHELRFITFSTGRRGCIGGGIGTTITVMLLARLLQGFTWSMPPNVDKIELTEALSLLFKANPLFAHAKPRLPTSLYMV